MKRYYVGALFLLMVFTGFGQSVDTIYWLPQFPTENDDVTLVVGTSFPSSSCSLQSQGIHPGANETIAVDGFYCTQTLGALCYSTDTFELGQLTPGVKRIRFKLHPNSNGACTTFDPPVISEASFPVLEVVVNGIEDTEKPVFDLYPNPASSGNVHYRLSTHNPALMHIHALDGKKVRSIQLIEKEGVVATNDLPQGSYFVSIETKEKTSKFRKLVVLE